jgi:hypothetical protein
VMAMAMVMAMVMAMEMAMVMVMETAIGIAKLVRYAGAPRTLLLI